MSLAILNADRSIAYFDHSLEADDVEGYLTNPDALELIHKAITNAWHQELSTASPIIFSWALILHRMYLSYQERVERRDLAQNQKAQAGFELDYQSQGSSTRRSSAGSVVSLEPARFDRFLTDTVSDMQVVEKLAMGVTAGGLVYDLLIDMALCAGSGSHAAFRLSLGSKIRLVLLDLLKTTYPVAGYQTEPVTCLSSLLSGSRESWENTKDGLTAEETLVVDSALNDPLLLRFYLYEAQKRSPYEFTPLVRLMRILSVTANQDRRSDTVSKGLLKTPCLTFVMPEGLDYELFDEDANSGRFRTLEDLPLFPAAASWKRRTAEDGPFTIPAGSEGQILSDTEMPKGGIRRVIIIKYEHSTLALLGKRLDIGLTRESTRPVLGFIGSTETADAITLLASLVSSELRQGLDRSRDHGTEEAALAVLQEASRELSANKDIISIVCDTLDSLVQSDMAKPDDPRLAVLAACVEFLHAVLPVCPGRIWSYMARCRLLNNESRAGRLSSLTGAADMTAERFRFLISSVQFLSGLTDSVLSSAIQRKGGIKIVQRQRNGDGAWLGTSDKILGQVGLAIAQTAIDVYENTTTWKFSSELDGSVLVRDVVRLLRRFVLDAFSFGETAATGSLTACLKPAAEYVVESFLAPSYGSLRFQPLVSTLLVALEVPQSTLYLARTAVVMERSTAVLEFATTLLEVAGLLGKPSTAIEAQLFKVASLPTRLSAAHDILAAPSLALLGALIASAGRGSSEPTSLLGYLGTQISKSFLQVLGRLDKPFNRPGRVELVGRFFATILKNRQQWLANCLLTGKTPREALQADNKTPGIAPDSVLGATKEALGRIQTLPPSEAVVMLDVFTSAQNYWPWTNLAIRGEAKYLEGLCAYAGKLESSLVTAKTDPLTACLEAKVAAYIAETFAMHLYHLRQVGQEEAFATEVVNHLDYFLREGVLVGAYNLSLHTNFQRNFAKRYPGSSLDDFKRTLLAPEALGPRYYYALEAAGKMLAFDPAWTGPRDNGFKTEMEMANLNLSLVDAQIALYHSWEFLLLELSTCLLPKNERIVAPMLQVATQCLTSNQSQQGPAQIFVRITQSRANLSLLLLQRLADAESIPKDISPLLTAVWTTMSAVEEPFSTSQIGYYRTLLKILYVVLRGWHRSSTPARDADARALDAGPDLSPIILNILDRVVANGFRTLVSLIHDADATVYPEDVALITAVLQACLSMPGIDQCQTQILIIMATHDVLHVATSLFSWSDRLADRGDPIYGELSLLFLLELSALPTLAEQLACDGLLGHLAAADLATQMRRPNVSPLAEAATAQRCYSIWSKALLPLLLNILIALGATIAPEVAYVLNQFPNLLDSSVQRFEAPGASRTSARGAPRHITLLAASEIHSLALLTRVLGALRVNNNRDIPEVAWDAAPLLENVEFWLSRLKLLREHLVPLGQREGEWQGTKPLTAGRSVENRLEEKVVGLLEAVRTVLGEGNDS